MSKNRDDFSEKTRHLAAGRVGYHCSFPQCPNVTVGASMEDGSRASTTGVACHIRAAAKGGPRYDESMTPEERKSIDNCIWMCQTHARLIDTDVETYTVENLEKMKKEAEEASSKALANGDFFSEHYKNNGDNLGVLQQIFDDMIIDGRYDELLKLLKQYTTPLSERYEEFVARYRVIYDVYCSRVMLKEHLDAYCLLPCKQGADDLAMLFISFQLRAELESIVDFCISENVRKYAEMTISGELDRQIVDSMNSKSIITVPAELAKTFSKLLVNYVRSHKIAGIKGLNGNAYPLYSDEFYFHAIVAAHNITAMTLWGNDDVEAITSSADFSFIKDNVKQINLLDAYFQEYIWTGVLAALWENDEVFQSIYDLCDEKLKSSEAINAQVINWKIAHDISVVSVDELLALAEHTNEFGPLLHYLSVIEKEQAVLFLDEHSYLYRKSIALIQIKIELSYKNNQSDGRLFLERYQDIYKDDFTYQCLLVEYASENGKNSERINWIISHREGMNIHNLFLYIHILQKAERWDELVALAKMRLPNEYMHYLAGCISQSNIDTYILESQAIYEGLLERKWERQGIRYRLGIIQHRLGLIEGAKKNFRDEYQKYNNDAALLKYMMLRYETNDYSEDEYLEKLKKSLDAQAQNLVGAIYLKRRDFNTAKKHFLRSLLLFDKENRSINGLWQASSSLPQVEIKSIREGTVSILVNKEKSLQIAIHPVDIMQGIHSPTRFANCNHYSVEDPRVANLLYCDQGATTLFDGDQYVIESISNADEFFSRFFFASMIGNDGAITIHGSSADELLANITPYLKSSSEQLERVVNEYNDQEILLPLSVFAFNTGRRMLTTLEFLLYENKYPIRNNCLVHGEENADSVFILSYDALGVLAHLDINLAELPTRRIQCARQVRQQILNDIDDELSNIADENSKASMFYFDGKPAIIERTAEHRRKRSAFLINLKTFVNSIEEAADSFDYEPHNEGLTDSIRTMLSKQPMYCESGTLALTQRTKNGVLVTDDQFLYALSNIDGICTVGIIGFLINVTQNWESLLNISKKLHRLNYANYLPLPLYKRIVDLLLEEDGEVKQGSNEIINWIRSDTDNEPTEHHEDVILTLARDVYLSQQPYLSPENLLEGISLTILERRNPGLVQELVANAFKATLNEAAGVEDDK